MEGTEKSQQNIFGTLTKPPIKSSLGFLADHPRHKRYPEFTKTAKYPNIIAVTLMKFAQRSSAGTAGVGVSVETGWRVINTKSMADRAAPAVVQPRLVRLLDYSK